MRQLSSISLLLLFLWHLAFSQISDPDDVNKARDLLQKQRQSIKNDSELSATAKAHKMLRLGLWKEAKAILDEIPRQDLKTELVRAQYQFLMNDFQAAEEIITNVLDRNAQNRDALLFKAKLQIEAWSLRNAGQICRQILEGNENDQEAGLLLGRIKMLEKNFTGALKWARAVQEWNPDNAASYLLESDVHFWNQKPELAETPLRKCLEIDPFNADARFNYGYMIWRRVDATQLAAMAAQWTLALEINPLHYVTHWHWGNGHTNQTYADYIHPADEKVRNELQPADSLITENKINDAIRLTRLLNEKYPESVLPAMLRGSIFYMAFDMDRNTRLDSAQAIFLSILEKKKNYGPAHNALAAVIKQKRISYLAAFDSLESVIKNTKITDWENFSTIFPDVSYYPGDRAEKMVWMQLYASTAYFPLLAKMNRKYVIPPLHIDLAIAMKNPFFRQATTFDNRQWMDIRGVGSGASGIEYVMRGAFLERNVVLHEYTHLFHGRVFTDQESRRVRQLYTHAMANDLTLDYYSANNESEYLAQTYNAYFEPVKVHPLNHKSINTTSDLKSKDPQLYAFLDSLVQKQQAYLAGNKQAFASNWAQVYRNLAEQATRKALTDSTANVAAAYLDTALVWDKNYLPAYLSYADLEIKKKKFKDAERWLKQAHQIDRTYAPIYTAHADRVEARLQNGKIKQDVAIKLEERFYKKALSLENDLAIRAQMNREFREFYRRNSLIPQAIAVADEYVKSAPTVSTYLRDRRDAALAFAAWLKGSLGYAAGPIAEFERLVSLKPQRYYLRGYFADVLTANGRHEKAIEVLNEALTIQQAAGNPGAEFMLRVAEYHLALNEGESAKKAFAPIQNGEVEVKDAPLRLVRVYAGLGETAKAEKEMNKIDKPKSPLEKSEFQFTLGKIWQAKDKAKKATKAYKKAVAANPYHISARLSLIEILVQRGKTKEAQKFAEQVKKLSLQPGPAFSRRLSEIF